MRGLPSDTHPEAERAHIALLRTATPAQRFAKVRSLSEMTLRLTRRALRRRHPDLSERDVDIELLAACYGRTLAERVRRYIERSEA